jgi:hypothetical protein
MFGKRIDVNSFKNKKSDGKQIIYFEYTIEANDNNGLMVDLVFRFYKLNSELWRIELVTTHDDGAPYRYKMIDEIYQIPNNAVPLTVICGIGLTAIKQKIEEEVHYYSGIQFLIADVVQNIVEQSNR